LVKYLVDDQVQVDGLFPVDVRITDGQFPAIPSEHLQDQNTVDDS